MRECIICRVGTNILLMELREPLCTDCLHAMEEVSLRASLLPPRATLRDPLTGERL